MAEGRRVEILQVLGAADTPLSIRQIADEVGVHPNTVRMHLDVLVEQGRAERVSPDTRRPGRPPLLFRAVPRMNPHGPRHFRLLAEILTASLAVGRDPRTPALRAGRRRGRELAASTPAKSSAGREAADRLVALLHDLDFAPERREVAGQPHVALRHCPFLEIAETGAQVVCSVHLGLMQGALESWGAPITVDRLEAFVEPDVCLARLAPAGAIQ